MVVVPGYPYGVTRLSEEEVRERDAARERRRKVDQLADVMNNARHGLTFNEYIGKDERQMCRLYAEAVLDHLEGSDGEAVRGDVPA